jgi:hypothetical protein
MANATSWAGSVGAAKGSFAAIHKSTRQPLERRENFRKLPGSARSAADRHSVMAAVEGLRVSPRKGSPNAQRLQLQLDQVPVCAAEWEPSPPTHRHAG